MNVGCEISDTNVGCLQESGDQSTISVGTSATIVVTRFVVSTNDCSVNVGCETSDTNVGCLQESGDQSSSSVGTAATIVATKSDDNGTAHSLSIDHDTAAGGTVGKVVKERVKDSHSDLCPSNAFHDTLTCIICREILHDCIRFFPLVTVFIVGSVV